MFILVAINSDLRQIVSWELCAPLPIFKYLVT